MTAALSEEVDTDRVVVKTTVLAYQKAEWVAEADQLGMTQAEYIRCMIQAGRRDFPFEPGKPDPAVGIEPDSIRQRVIEMLQQADYLTIDEIENVLVHRIDETVRDVLAELDDDGKIRRGRLGESVVVELREDNELA